MPAVTGANEILDRFGLGGRFELLRGERPACTIGSLAANAAGQFDVRSRHPEIFTKPEQAQAFAATLAVSA